RLWVLHACGFGFCKGGSWVSLCLTPPAHISRFVESRSIAISTDHTHPPRLVSPHTRVHSPPPGSQIAWPTLPDRVCCSVPSCKSAAQCWLHRMHTAPLAAHRHSVFLLPPPTQPHSRRCSPKLKA